MDTLNLKQYLDPKHLQDFLHFIADKPTPFLAVDLQNIEHRFNLLKTHLPKAQIFYAIKANPAPEILELLRDLGCCFDIASVYELDLLLNLKVDPKHISYGNTIKKASDITYAHSKGVQFFACDSSEDVNTISKYAPGSKVFFRLIADGRGSDWPLSKKFGCHPHTLENIILSATKKQIIPYGISFHVGSQQRDIGQWDAAIKQTYFLFESLKEKGIKLKMLNIGGGLPCDYLNKTQPLENYLSEINRYLTESFENVADLKIFIEPGRALVGNAGIIVSEVINKTKKASSDLHSWVFLDIGIFNGLIETLGEAVKYPIVSLKNLSSVCSVNPKPPQQPELEEMIIAGPTCDSMDILYREHKYPLPKSLSAGEKLLLFATGAYTLTYSTISFNGFPPLRYYIWRR